MALTGWLAGCPPTNTPAPDDAPPPDALLNPAAMRRLSVAELRYILGDLLGADVTADLTFPTDPTPDGFDNQVAGADVSPQLLAQVDLAAARAGEHLAATWLTEVAHVEPVEQATDCEYAVADLHDEADSWWIAFEGSEQSHDVQVPVAGPHAVVLPVRFLRSNCEQVATGCELHDLDVELMIDGSTPIALTVPAYQHGDPTPIPLLHTAVVDLSSGTHTITWRVLPADRGPIVPFEPHLRCYTLDGVAVDHLDVHRLDPRLACDTLPGDLSCLHDAFAQLAERAWRRPLADDDRTLITDLASAVPATGDTLPEVLSSVAHGLFFAPKFLFVQEPTLDDGRLDAHALAEHLALTLWSSTPDDPLLDCARDGRLLNDTTGDCALSAQVDRMMADVRFERFVTTFSTQWLHLDNALPPATEGIADPAALAADMRAETFALLRRALLDPSLPIPALHTTTTASLTPALADWYGLSGGGDAVDVSAVDRAGLLGQAAIQQATSRGGRVLPVYRGVWILNALLCDPPEPPPPGIPLLADSTEGAFDAHTTLPGCAECHQALDPLGAALTAYDAWGQPVTPWNTPHTLPDGTKLPSVPAVSAWLAEDRRFLDCSVSRLATRLTGRAVAPDDVLVERALHGGDNHLGAALRTILLDDTFRRRMTEAHP